MKNPKTPARLPRKAPSNQTGGTAWGKKLAAEISRMAQAADLKKLIREVEVTKNAEAEQEDAFFDEEDGEFYDEEDPEEKKDGTNSWDDIEFL